MSVQFSSCAVNKHLVTLDAVARYRIVVGSCRPSVDEMAQQLHLIYNTAITVNNSVISVSITMSAFSCRRRRNNNNLVISAYTFPIT